MKPRLEGFAQAVLGAAEAADSARLAEELSAVDHLLTSNTTLRAAITDTAVAPAARRAVLEDLLADRVSDPVRRVVGFAASAVPAQDVPAAVSWLAHRAHRMAEGHQIQVAQLGHLDARERVGGFAAALFEDLSTNQLEEMEDELFRFARVVETTPALRAALVDREIPEPVRQEVVDDLLAGKVQPATLRLVNYAVAAGRPRDLVGTLFWLVDRTAEARGWRVALVVAAREVADEQRDQLSRSLSRLAGWPVQLQVTVDPALLAGVRVRIGDLQVDATARSRLEQLREHMLPGSWGESRYGGASRGGPAQGTQEEGAD